tara:strand:+ start:14584 stop:14727 length:144 start_codon:yes stop_codon:yes gene_type:complete
VILKGYIEIPEDFWESSYSTPLISDSSESAYIVTHVQSSPKIKDKDA